MIAPDIQLMTTLGVVIILLLLLIMLPILISIKRHQKKNIECLDTALEAIEKFNSNVSKVEGVISDNFKEVHAKNVILDSKQVSIGDKLKDISQGLELYHTKTMTAIDRVLKTSNKPLRTTKSNGQRNTPTKS